MNLTEKDCCNKALCSRCKGRCCKETGCFFMPEDFERIEVRYLKNEVDKGYISISAALSIFGIPLPKPILYLKIRNKGASICDLSECGECMLLTDKGCELSFEKRPSGGKGLIPRENNACYSVFSKTDILQSWKPYDDILRKLWSFYTNLSVEQTIEKAKQGD